MTDANLSRAEVEGGYIAEHYGTETSYLRLQQWLGQMCRHLATYKRRIAALEAQLAAKDGGG